LVFSWFQGTHFQRQQSNPKTSLNFLHIWL
jgi:hypothetical protein